MPAKPLNKTDQPGKLKRDRTPPIEVNITTDPAREDLVKSENATQTPKEEKEEEEPLSLDKPKPAPANKTDVPEKKEDPPKKVAPSPPPPVPKKEAPAPPPPPADDPEPAKPAPYTSKFASTQLMRYYKDFYKPLDGYGCFQAEGKFCHSSGSSQYGHGYCCKPGYNGKNCSNVGFWCSQPAAARDTSSEFMKILTDGRVNNQFFAFLPTDPYRCGISNNPKAYFDGSMRIYAGPVQKTISLTGKNALKFTESKNSTRRFESCFYEIGLAEQAFNRTSKNNLNLKLILTISKLKNMNVFVYQGQNRNTAVVPINNNQQLQPGTNYTVGYTKGMLLVAYPMKNVETEFEFSYVVEPKETMFEWVLRESTSSLSTFI